MSNLSQRIEDVLFGHRIIGSADSTTFGGVYSCQGCDFESDYYDHCGEHQAAMVVAAIPAFGVQHENGHISLTSSRADCEAFIAERGGPLHLVERSAEWRPVLTVGEATL